MYCVCETSMWALPFWRPQAISLLDLGPVGWPSWLQRALKQPTRSKFHPHGRETRWYEDNSGCCCCCWRCRSSCWRGVAPEDDAAGAAAQGSVAVLSLEMFLLLQVAMKQQQAREAMGGRGAAVGIYQTAKKKRYFAAILAKQMPEIVRSLDNGAQR